MLHYLLSAYKEVLGRDYDRYHNHVCRVFLNCRLLDATPGNEKKYAIAAVFHDIGIWTHRTIDYLGPSIAETRQYLMRTDRQEWVEEISLMIAWHHKTTPYRGRYSDTVEVFRKADWMDVTLGLLRFGVDRKTLGMNRKRFRNLGFHVFLLKRIAMGFLRKPIANPLPMFRR